MWLFLATEVMFFTGLIGSYIVLRAGSPATSYLNLYPPTTNLREVKGTFGVLLRSAPTDHAAAQSAIREFAPNLSDEQVAGIIEHANELTVVNRLTKEQAASLAARLTTLGVKASVQGLETHGWPKPYDELTNPLSINLTAINPFVLICSSLTMVLALSAIQQGKRWKCVQFLGATILLGGLFLGVQISEYYELLVGRHYPPGISASGHFRPDVSLFASCFFTMTGFHGLHVAAGC